MNKLEQELITDGYIKIKLKKEKELTLYGKDTKRIILSGGHRIWGEYESKIDLGEKLNDKDIMK